MLVILFGLAGAGKTYTGKLLSKNSNSYFWDADEALTDEMKECIREKRSFTQAMRDRYFSLVIERMKIICSEHEHVVVSQAFYKNENREQILSEFPNSLFIQVVVKPTVLFQRLRERNNDVDEDYLIKISLNFETPTHPYYLINNDLENYHYSLLRQLKQIPGLASILTNVDIRERDSLHGNCKAKKDDLNLSRFSPLAPTFFSGLTKLAQPRTYAQCDSSLAFAMVAETLFNPTIKSVLAEIASRLKVEVLSVLRKREESGAAPNLKSLAMQHSKDDKFVGALLSEHSEEELEKTAKGRALLLSAIDKCLEEAPNIHTFHEFLALMKAIDGMAFVYDEFQREKGKIIISVIYWGSLQEGTEISRNHISSCFPSRL